jgi:hypothetical protein
VGFLIREDPRKSAVSSCLWFSGTPWKSVLSVLSAVRFWVYAEAGCPRIGRLQGFAAIFRL